MNETARTWAEIDLSALRHNYQLLCDRLSPGAGLLGIVKADGYGHGAIQAAKTLEAAGCGHLAVATLAEGEELRSAGITLPILVLGPTDPAYTRALLELELTQTISTLADAKQCSEAALAAGRKLPVHLKLETGMGRTGIDCREGREPHKTLEAIAALEGLEICGVFTHFAVSESDETYTRLQFTRFLDVCSVLEAILGHPVPLKHCANSGATLQYPEMHLDLVRPGIALYGILPEAGLPDPGLVPVMAVKTRIAQLHTLQPGDSVSYGRRFVAESPRTVAVLPMGYADGLHRAMSGHVTFLLNGIPVPQVGSICMDMCMVDVTDVPGAAVGDVVTVFDKNAPVSRLAEAAGTIPYELLCSVSRRVPRIFL